MLSATPAPASPAAGTDPPTADPGTQRSIGNADAAKAREDACKPSCLTRRVPAPPPAAAAGDAAPAISSMSAAVSFPYSGHSSTRSGHACSRAQDAEKRPRELQAVKAHLGRWRAQELEEALD